MDAQCAMLSFKIFSRKNAVHASKQASKQGQETRLLSHVTGLALTTTKQKEGRTSWQIRQRHLKQILVRGDNVVMIYKAESERSAWPRTAKSPTKSVHGRKAVVVSKEERVGSPGSLIYSLQQQQQQQQQKSRRRPHSNSNQRYDYQSTTR